MKGECLEDSYHVQMMINLLIRFPDIFTISFNLDAASCCLSYMVRRKIENKNYIIFQKKLEESLAAYRYFKNKEHHRTAVRKKTYRGMTQIEIELFGEQYLREEIALITSFVRDVYGRDLICAVRPEDRPGDGKGLMEYLQKRKPGEDSKNLFAFREAGKVYVYDG